VGFLKDGPVFPGPFAGLLAHPDAFDSPILRGIDSATDEMLLNSRAAVCEAPAWWQAVFARTGPHQPARGPWTVSAPGPSDRITLHLTGRSCPGLSSAPPSAPRGTDVHPQL
jgi:hypothetical protein